MCFYVYAYVLSAIVFFLSLFFYCYDVVLFFFL